MNWIFIFYQIVCNESLSAYLNFCDLKHSDIKIINKRMHKIRRIWGEEACNKNRFMEQLSGTRGFGDLCRSHNGANIGLFADRMEIHPLPACYP